jgi:acetyl esterase/lipase
MKIATSWKIWGLIPLFGLLGNELWGDDGSVAFKVTRDVSYVTRGETDLKADVYSPDGPGPFPGVLVVHGGAWAGGNKSHMERVSRLLVGHAYTVVAINYRLAPQFPFPAQIEDCKTAVRWMRSNAALYKIDPTHIAGYGYSAGGHLVTLLGTTDPTCGLEGPDVTPESPDTRLQCVVAGGAPCDFRIMPADNKTLAFWLGGSRAEKPDLYELASPAKFISKDDPPVFFFHGEHDWLVPVASPQFMVAQLKAVGVTASLLTLPQTGHIAAFLDKAPVLEAIKFLDTQLKPSAKE